MSNKKKLIAGIISVVALSLIGYALVSHHNETQRKEEAAKVEAARQARLAKAERKRKQEAAAQQKAVDDCHSLMDGLVNDLTDLDSEISIGMVYADYTERVREVRVSYGRIKFDELEASCIEHVALDAEKAVNRYAQASNIWGDAIDGGYEVDESELQEKWSSARRLINHSTEGFDSVKAGDLYLTDQS